MRLTRRDMLGLTAGAGLAITGETLWSRHASAADTIKFDWHPGNTVPLIEGKQIIIAARAEKSQPYVYNVVFYYKPMDVLYGGPGIEVRREDIEWWSEIQTPA